MAMVLIPDAAAIGRISGAARQYPGGPPSGRLRRAQGRRCAWLLPQSLSMRELNDDFNLK
jgi:hypothetical protein